MDSDSTDDDHPKNDILSYQELQNALHKALEQLQDRERELVLAAEIGQNLLETNTLLQQRYDALVEETMVSHHGLSESYTSLPMKHVISDSSTCLEKDHCGFDSILELHNDQCNIFENKRKESDETTHEKSQSSSSSSHTNLFELSDEQRRRHYRPQSTTQMNRPKSPYDFPPASINYLEELERVNEQLEHQLSVSQRSQNLKSLKIERLEHELEETKASLSFVRDEHHVSLREVSRLKHKLNQIELEQAMTSIGFEHHDTESTLQASSSQIPSFQISTQGDHADLLDEQHVELQKLRHQISILSAENDELHQSQNMRFELEKITQTQQTQIQELLSQLEDARNEIDSLRLQVSSYENLRPSTSALHSPFVFDRVMARSDFMDRVSRVSSATKDVSRKDLISSRISNSALPSTPLSRKQSSILPKQLPTTLAKNILLEEDSPDRRTEKSSHADADTDSDGHGDEDIFYTPFKPRDMMGSTMSTPFLTPTGSKTVSVVSSPLTQSKWKASRRGSPMVHQLENRPIEMSSMSMATGNHDRHDGEDSDDSRLFDKPLEGSTAGSVLVNILSKKFGQLWRSLPLSPPSKKNSSTISSLPVI